MKGVHLLSSFPLDLCIAEAWRLNHEMEIDEIQAYNIDQPKRLIQHVKKILEIPMKTAQPTLDTFFLKLNTA